VRISPTSATTANVPESPPSLVPPIHKPCHSLSLDAPGSEVASPLEMGNRGNFHHPRRFRNTSIWHQRLDSKWPMVFLWRVVSPVFHFFVTSGTIGPDQPLPPRKRVKTLQSPQMGESPVLHRRSMARPPTSPLALHSFSAADSKSAWFNLATITIVGTVRRMLMESPLARFHRW
jgi:hypothetical protein